MRVIPQIILHLIYYNCSSYWNGSSDYWSPETKDIFCFWDSRHNQGFVSWLAQESIDEHRGAGEVVNSPRPSFIDAKSVEKQAMFTVTTLIKVPANKDIIVSQSLALKLLMTIKTIHTQDINHLPQAIKHFLRVFRTLCLYNTNKRDKLNNMIFWCTISCNVSMSWQTSFQY